MEREQESFSRKDLEILRSLRDGRDLDRLFDRADLEGHRYTLRDLNRLREIAPDVGYSDVVEKIPYIGIQEIENILKNLRFVSEKYTSKKVCDRMGLERGSVWLAEGGLDKYGEANMVFVRRIGFALGCTLKELTSDIERY